MIPTNEDYDEENDDLESDFDIETDPSLTYRLDFESNRIIGKVDDKEAIEQAIFKIIQTQRSKFDIYSDDYGFESDDLIGASTPYVLAVVKKRIIDALTADDRIDSVDAFEIEKVGKKTLYVKFTANTTTGDEYNYESEVDL